MKKILFIIAILFYCSSFIKADRGLFYNEDEATLYYYDYYIKYDCPMCSTGEVILELTPVGYGPTIVISGGRVTWPKITLFDNEQTTCKLDLEGSLSISTNNNTMVEVYELVSGKYVINSNISRNSKIVLHNIENNKHYIIIFKMSDGSMQQQVFFVNNNQLFERGQ